MQELTPAEVGIVKLAAAIRMKELVPNIRPATADYIFARHIQKSACAGVGNTPNLAQKASPAKTEKNPGVKAAPPAETIAADGGAIAKGASVHKLASLLAATIQKLADDTPGEEEPTPEVPETTPAKTDKPKGKKPAPSGTIGPQPTDENSAD